NLKNKEIKLLQVAPGRYQASFSASEVGAYLLNVVGYDGKDLLGFTSTGFVVPYSMEYKSLETHTFLLSKIAEITEGEMLRPSGEDKMKIFQHSGKSLKKSTDLSLLLLTLALLLVPLDIALRRVMFGEEKIQAIQNKLEAFKNNLVPKKRTQSAKPAFSRLLIKKREEKMKAAINKEKRKILLEEKEGEIRPASTRRLLDAKKKIRK
ncbi:MAG: hypothetical protein ACE5KE_16170, partial [Methanosarcinales archaeon]